MILVYEFLGEVGSLCSWFLNKNYWKRSFKAYLLVTATKEFDYSLSLSLSLSLYPSLSYIPPGRFSYRHLQLIYPSYCWSANAGTSMGLKKNFLYEFDSAPSALSRISCSSYSDDFWDGRCKAHQMNWAFRYPVRQNVNKPKLQLNSF